MKGIVCLQVYKRILEATLFSTVAGQERVSMGLSKCCQLCQADGGNFTKTWGEICVDWANEGSLDSSWRQQFALCGLILNFSSCET